MREPHQVLPYGITRRSCVLIPDASGGLAAPRVVGNIHTPPLPSFIPQPSPLPSATSCTSVSAIPGVKCLNAPAGEHSGALCDGFSPE